MTTLTQPLNWFIQDQVKKGTISSGEEAEKIIMQTLEERETDRILQARLAEADRGETIPFDDESVKRVQARGRALLSNI